MTDDTLGIIGVFAFTGVLFLLRHLILAVGKPKGQPSPQRSSPPMRSSLRAVEIHGEKEREELRTNSVMRHSQPSAYPRFRV